ncbi:hypothetical protein ES703_112085 [subsurface metagenome]
MQDWLTETLDGIPDPLQAAGLQAGRAPGHFCFLHAVLENLEHARGNRALWRML